MNNGARRELACQIMWHPDQIGRVSNLDYLEAMEWTGHSIVRSQISFSVTLSKNFQRLITINAAAGVKTPSRCGQLAPIAMNAVSYTTLLFPFTPTLISGSDFYSKMEKM
ncbi:hypothetical protein B0H13DRAFT_1878052 [Mycena leptocephala]|nr:hypothetical protein B0H13DRAFT_1878052 [Mycena leptocephala]